MLALDLQLHLYLLIADGFAVVVLCGGAGGTGADGVWAADVRRAADCLGHRPGKKQTKKTNLSSSCAPFYTAKSSNCQDGLGTNVGNSAQKRRPVVASLQGIDPWLLPPATKAQQVRKRDSSRRSSFLLTIAFPYDSSLLLLSICPDRLRTNRTTIELG